MPSDTPTLPPSTEPNGTLPATVQDRPCCIVGIGASAGGLEALQRFFDNVPDGSDLAYVVVQHLSPVHKSLMADLLSKHTRMEVIQAADGMAVERNVVYLLPPGKHMTIDGRRLRLTAKEAATGISLPIDIFFAALAHDQGPLAIGVILSGTGSDGTRGLLAIKSAGGFAAVQDPETAQFDGMPRSAIAAAAPDTVLAPEALPGSIVEHAGRAIARARPLPARREPSAAGDPLAQIVATIRLVTGVDFSLYKLATLMRRIERRMHAVGLESPEDYAAFLRANSAEAVTLYKEMLIGVTRFFRDEAAFRALAAKAVTGLVRKMGQPDTIRVWVCGCATGEEAYSIAMLFIEAMEEQGRTVDVKIFATDIDQDSIEFAGTGEYPRSIAEDVNEQRLARFFQLRGERYVVSRELRRMVVFAQHNIMRDPPFTRMDLISCRNLLIYMDTPLQRKVLGLFQYALRQGGFLFLGSSESLGDLAPEFHTVDSRNKLFQSLRAGSYRLSRLLLPQRSAPPVRGDHLSMDGHGEENLAIDEAIGVLLNTYVPPCLLVNEQLNILHVFGDAGPILRVPAGEATLSVLKLLPASVAMVAGTALNRVFRSSEEFALANIPVKDREGLSAISLRVKPFASRKSGRRYALVLLEPTVRAVPPADTPFDLNADAAERIRGLEQELMSRGENLQATIEELETANEELQATNEELLASNEELQSTNEELQSVNEELYSVNAEYQAKVEELTEMTADLDNLLRSTAIGVVFLDDDMVIRRFTPAAASFINIIPRDVGRPIAHLSTNIDYPDFLRDIRAVFTNSTPVERHVRVGDGRWIQTRILPYLSEKNTVEGAVITFIDVTATRNAQERLRTIIDSLPEHIAVLDAEGTITMTNASWQRFAAATATAPPPDGGGDMPCGPPVPDGPNGLDRSPLPPAVRDGLRRVVTGEAGQYGFEYPCRSAAGSHWYLLTAVRLTAPVSGAVVSHIDVTNRKLLELRLAADDDVEGHAPAAAPAGGDAP
ncbi:chemotaxis protein CheB [Azospirillum halopraeferens]|uniref:chemotaxis protein CheB n=1 Tax=Azospirillum halopraeferens TaxID=34010 RepID=UPI000425306A|nr:chemotaxis protein CheB [Azospirillum halopraeferens]